ncbi:MAG TPA: metallophosphoesterase [Terriglobales bacterium]|nr:metallophosphoesterase [Terriglobales bacterium]
MASLNRRKFLVAAGVISASALGFGEEGLIREPSSAVLVRVEMALARLPTAFDGFTIAQLSDFHYNEVFTVTPIQKAIQIVNGLHPDLVVLTGDFVTTSVFSRKPELEAARAAEPCAKLLRALRSQLGSLAVLGNHDVAADPHLVTEALEAQGITVLRNRSQVLERGANRLWLCGLDSMEGHPRLDLALQGVPGNESVVLCMHEPDFADAAARHPVDLQLSGHSHGGQVWIPGLGAPWLPLYARKYPRGRYRVGELSLYTNIGLGTIRIPMRFNCIPEVTLITLRALRAS